VKEQPPTKPRLEHVTNIENEYLRWSRRIKPPTEYRRGFNELVSDLFSSLSLETGYSLNNLRQFPESLDLPERTAIIFRELWEYFHDDWFASDEDDEEFHVPD
jgi:hypothetical protein